MLFNKKLSDVEIIDKLDDNTIYANVPLNLIDLNNWLRHGSESDFEFINTLVGSIIEVGVIVPILLRPIEGSNRYEVVDGNFRVKAAKIAREKRIPSIIKKNLTGNDLEARITALAVHIHREPLTEEEKEIYLKELRQAKEKPYYSEVSKYLEPFLYPPINLSSSASFLDLS